MLVAAAAPGVLALAGLVTSWTLLALLFAVGTGQLMTSPTWQTLQPELVSPPERTQAISLGPLANLRWRFQSINPADLVPAGDVPQPGPPGSGAEPVGPILVSVQYKAQSGQADELITQLRDARFARRRTGLPLARSPSRRSHGDPTVSGDDDKRHR